ncbi:MAG TPA: hypothetical protein PLU50_11985, partial [Pseudobdellovibrionaceae bacterium]|nr:hypothetical protein [Pseudobdellovibrionaceae bacterium]
MQWRNFFSDLVLRKVFIFLAVIQIAGCGLNVGEKAAPPEPQKFNSRCLADSLPTFKKYFTGDTDADSVHEAWSCVRSAIIQFKRYVRSRESSDYPATEFASFVKQNFLAPETEVSPELVTEMMRIKQIFLGGNLEMISRNDLDRSLQIFGELEDILIELLPSMRVLSMSGFADTKTDDNKKKLAESDRALQRAAERFGGLIERNQVSYPLDHAVVLSTEIAKMYKENWDFVTSLQRWLPFIKKIKKTIAGGDEESILSREWSGFLVMGARTYTQYLRYYYFVDHSEGAELGL